MLQFISRDLEKDELYFTFDITSYDVDSIEVDIIYDALRREWKELSKPIELNYNLYIVLFSSPTPEMLYSQVEKDIKRIYFNTNNPLLYIKLVRKYII